MKYHLFRERVAFFEVRTLDKVLWSRKEKGRFPDIKELKQIVRDNIAPDKDLGHTDR